jgi:hypothetical protein
MTEPTPPTSDDELVSAVLDGEATQGEIARVTADPALQARLERMTAVSDAVGVAPPPPAGLVDQAIDAALDHLTATGPGTVAAPLDELSARRAARNRRFGPFLAAAAVVVLVALGAVAVRSLDDPDSDTDTAAASLDAADAETAAEEFAENDAGAADTAAEAPSEPTADTTTGTRSAETIDAADADEFAGRVRIELEQGAESSVPTTRASTTPPPPAGELPTAAADFECEAAGTLLDRPGPVIRTGAGLLDGEPVAYSVIDAPEGLVLVIIDAGCGVIAEIAL